MTLLASAGSLPRLAVDASRSSVAVVDDDPEFARYLETFLAVRGYDTRSYTRGDGVLAAIRHGERPDTVLLDVAMPGMDGLQTLKALRRRRRRTSSPLPRKNPTLARMSGADGRIRQICSWLLHCTHRR